VIVFLEVTGTEKVGARLDFFQIGTPIMRTPPPEKKKPKKKSRK
jgi:hypothetical protein